MPEILGELLPVSVNQGWEPVALQMVCWLELMAAQEHLKNHQFPTPHSPRGTNGLTLE